MNTIISKFQCRTQHCVCWDIMIINWVKGLLGVSMPHAALCVLGRKRLNKEATKFRVSMPHAALCVLGHCVPQPLSRAG